MRVHRVASALSRAMPLPSAGMLPMAAAPFTIRLKREKKNGTKSVYNRADPQPAAAAHALHARSLSESVVYSAGIRVARVEFQNPGQERPGNGLVPHAAVRVCKVVDKVGLGARAGGVGVHGVDSSARARAQPGRAGEQRHSQRRVLFRSNTNTTTTTTTCCCCCFSSFFFGFIGLI